jgi:hypothetical protein
MTADAASPSHEDGDLDAPEPDPGAAGFLGGLSRDTKVLLGAVLLTVIQLAVTAQLVSHQWFYQDDFAFEANARRQGLGWSYLMTPHNTHLMPGGLAIAWVVTRLSPMNWALVATSLLIMQAFAAFAVFRLLRLFFGSRPAILALFAFYLFCPLGISTSGWLAAALEIVPFEAMLALALGSHLRYLRTGERKHAIAAFVFTVLGFCFMAKAVVIPLVLFAITAYYFTEATTFRAAAVNTLRKYWRIWPFYAALMIGYETFYQHRLDQVGSNAGLPDSLRTNWQFSEYLVVHTFVPGLAGGPWRWSVAPYDYAFANAPAALVYLSWLLLAAVIALSVHLRRRAARAWWLLACYVVIADIVPVLIGRISEVQPDFVFILGNETRYVADASVAAAVCLGLAFLPIVGESDPYRRTLRLEERFSGLAQSAVGALGVLLAVGLVTSTVEYHRGVTGEHEKAWFQNAEHQLAVWSDPSTILDTPVPGNLALDWFYDTSRVSYILSSVEPRKKTAAIANATPTGPVFVFNDQGDLQQIDGVQNGPLAPDGVAALHGPNKDWGYCLSDNDPLGYVDIALPQNMAWQHWTLHMGYGAHSPVTFTIQFGIAKQTMTLPAGVNNVTFNLPGNGSLIRISGVQEADHNALCIISLNVGTPKLKAD